MFPSSRFRVIRTGKDFYEVHARVRVTHERHASAPAASVTVAPSAGRVFLADPSFAMTDGAIHVWHLDSRDPATFANCYAPRPARRARGASRDLSGLLAYS